MKRKYDIRGETVNVVLKKDKWKNGEYRLNLKGTVGMGWLSPDVHNDLEVLYAYYDIEKFIDETEDGISIVRIRHKPKVDISMIFHVIERVVKK